MRPDDTKGACTQLKKGACLNFLQLWQLKNYIIETPGGIDEPPPASQPLFHFLSFYPCAITLRPFCLPLSSVPNPL